MTSLLKSEEKVSHLELHSMVGGGKGEGEARHERQARRVREGEKEGDVTIPKLILLWGGGGL